MLSKERSITLAEQTTAKKRTDAYCMVLRERIHVGRCLARNERVFYDDLINAAKPLFYYFALATNKMLSLGELNNQLAHYSTFSACGAAIVLLKKAAPHAQKQNSGHFARLFANSTAMRPLDLDATKSLTSA
jgi:hypothetical protein